MSGFLGLNVEHNRRSGQGGITLVELLIGMSIMTVLTTMVLMGWFSLSRSYSFSIQNADARDYAREAISRIQREVRDAQKPPTSYTGSASAADAIVYRARPYSIAVSTTFNEVGNDVMAWSTPTPAASPSASPTVPRLVIYRLYLDGELWRFEDMSTVGTSGYGTIDGLTSTLNSSYPTDWPVTEQLSGEGARLLLKNVVNWTAHPGHPAPLFDYNYYDADGVLHSSNQIMGTDRYNIIAVQIRVLVDLNPAKAPIYADLRSTAELRNAR